MILTADWHLTDKPEDDYRWRAFDSVLDFMAAAGARQHVYILGDLTDRKDRHSAELVNRLIDELRRLGEQALSITIIMGNHDAPMKGRPYWDVLNKVTFPCPVQFYATPALAMGGRLLLLPWTAKPGKTWAEGGLQFSKTPGPGGAIFMHQTVHGALMESGQRAEVEERLMFPRNVKVYSGDVHTPHRVGFVEYVGAPHHVKFGDHYALRMLLLNDAFEIEEVYEPRPPEKLLMEASSLDDWETTMLFIHTGAQIKIRMPITASQLNEWPAMQRRMHELCSDKGVRIDSIEAIMVTEGADDADPDGFKPRVTAATLRPLEVLGAFCDKHNVDAAHRRVGEALLEEVING